MILTVKLAVDILLTYLCTQNIKLLAHTHTHTHTYLSEIMTCPSKLKLLNVKNAKCFEMQQNISYSDWLYFIDSKQTFPK